MFSVKTILSTLIAVSFSTVAVAAPAMGALPGTTSGASAVAPIPTTPAAAPVVASTPAVTSATTTTAASAPQGVMMVLPNHDLIIVMPGDVPPPGAVLVPNTMPVMGAAGAPAALATPVPAMNGSTPAAAVATPAAPAPIAAPAPVVKIVPAPAK